MATIENNSILNNLSLSAIASQYAQGISNYNSHQIAQQYRQQMAIQQSQYIRQPSAAAHGLVGPAGHAMSSGGYSMGSSLSPQPVARGISQIADLSQYMSKETLSTLVLDTDVTESIKNWWVQGAIGTFENTKVEPAFSATVTNIPTKS